MKKILLTSVASLVITGIAQNAMATWGTEGHVDLNGAKEAIERVDNSWAVINGLQEAVRTADGDINQKLASIAGYLAEAPADDEGDGDKQYGENSNVGVISGIITDTAKIQEGFYTTLSMLTGDKNTEGSVDYKIETLSEAISASSTKLQNDVFALDSKVNELDENLSAGIASSVALSSVAVANVQKGEMSVGGGYGNYNSKSAMAFGAALGITNNWSANAGVGLGFGKDTKASFRVGTNYKFKLF
ncbi:MAG: YadA C-terminal domain-containing protein [Proteobacteria bacterium]|nr:YadA C-terminal domain-containing protein [Candidatus Enterousia scatequi]